MHEHSIANKLIFYILSQSMTKSSRSIHDTRQMFPKKTTSFSLFEDTIPISLFWEKSFSSPYVLIPVSVFEYKLFLSSDLSWNNPFNFLQVPNCKSMFFFSSHDITMTSTTVTKSIPSLLFPCTTCVFVLIINNV